MHDDRTGLGRFPLPRRTLLAAAGVLATPLLLPGAARAQAGGKVILGTWGGDYQRLLNENVEQPFLTQQGIEVVVDAANEDVRYAKLMATRRLPRGQMDVACMGPNLSWQLAADGVLEPLDESKIPNLKYVRKNIASPTFAPHIYSPQVLIYNPERVPAAPTSFGDLLDAKYNGKVGFPDANHPYVMMAAALYATGNAMDFEKAKEVLLKLNTNGLRLYPSTDSAGPPFKTGELDVGVMWYARVVMWQNAGIPVKAAFPKEGCVLYISGMVVPRNAPNKEAAFKYINAMLQPAAQVGFARNMGYLPTVDNAPLSGKIAEQLAMPEPPPKLAVPDFAYVGKVQTEIADWWKKNIQHT